MLTLLFFQGGGASTTTAGAPKARKRFILPDGSTYWGDRVNAERLALRQARRRQEKKETPLKVVFSRSEDGEANLLKVVEASFAEVPEIQEPGLEFDIPAALAAFQAMRDEEDAIAILLLGG